MQLRKVKAFFFSFLWSIVVFLLSVLSIKTPETGSLNIPHFDKLVHFALYFVWGVIVVFEFRRYYSQLSLNNKLWIIAGGGLYGALMEFLQWLITSDRHADFVDAVFNVLGVVVAVYFCSKVKFQSKGTVS